MGQQPGGSRFRNLKWPVRTVIVTGTAVLVVAGGLWLGQANTATTLAWPDEALAQQESAPVAGTISWLSWTRGPADRRPMIIQSYQRAFGRDPSEAEIKFWSDQPSSDPRLKTVDTLVAAHKTWLAGAPAERQAVVKRAFQKALKRDPSAAEAKDWDAQLMNGKDYEEILPLVAQIKAPAPAVQVSAPANFKVWASSPYQLDGSYTQVGSNVANFQVQKWTGYEWKLLMVQVPSRDGATITFSDSGAPETQQTYRICAYDASGKEACTGYTSATTLAAAKIQAPVGFKVVAGSAYRLDGTYTQVGDNVARFQVQKWTGYEWKLLQQQSPARNGAILTFSDSTKPSTGETYRVCAYDSDGKEACTGYTGAVTPAAPTPAPSNVVVRGKDEQNIQVSWQMNGGKNVKVQYLRNGQWLQAAAGDATATWAVLDTSSSTAESYTIRVCAGTDQGDVCSDPVVQGRQFDHPLNFTALDYGIYWVRCGSCRESTKADDKGWNSDEAKAVPGLSKEYFDPSKPTVIYVHGWEKDTVKRQYRESMKSDTTGEDMAGAWKDAGWNVGIFYWNQFSDDDWGAVPNDTEPKIWTATDQVGMRYKIYNPAKKDAEFAPNKLSATAADLFYESYMKAMADYQGDNIRIVGHSLGNQMAVRMVKILSDHNPPARLIPKRIALLDPYYTSDSKYWLPGKTTTYNMIGNFVADLKAKRNIVFEYYKSSGITPEPSEVIRKTVYGRLNPNYADWFHGAHVAAVHWYFRSFEWNLWALDGSNKVGFGPTAGMTDDQLRQLDGNGYWYWQRDPGSKTTKVDDDSFDRKRW